MFWVACMKGGIGEMIAAFTDRFMSEEKILEHDLL